MTTQKDKATLHVEGMTCTNCAMGIQKNLQKNGLQNVVVNFSTAEVTYSKSEQQDTDTVIRMIENLGYRAKIKKEAKTESVSGIEKKLYISLIFTIPLFSHMFFSAESVLHFPLVQFLLCLPVFVIGLLHFGKSAFGSIKVGLPNMDVLIFIGSTAAFFYSIFGWWLFHNTNESSHYLFFETTATIITLVLLGNVLEHRSVSQTTSAIRDLAAIKNGIAKKEENGKISEIAFDEIRAGDIILVNMGDKIPVDGNVLLGNALVDESMLTGESIPVEKQIDSNLIGGTILISGSVKMKAVSVGEDTLLSQIIDLVKNAEENKPKIQKIGDKVSGIFVPIVLLISVITFLISFFILDISITDSFLRAIAVLVISCPCAMGLATPTAVMVGIGRAAKSGILLKGGATLEKLASIKHLVFDKTGTITTGEFAIKSITVLEANHSFVNDMIFSLEKHSSHPIAKSLVKNLQPTTNYLELDNVKEEKGIGISATYLGDEYQIGSNRIVDSTESGQDIYLLKNKKIIARIDLEDDLKKDVFLVMEKIKSFGIETVLLSGDKKEKCTDLQEKLQFSAVFSEQLPDEKLDVIQNLVSKSPTAMLGDGINDAPALATATVGISIGNATEIAIQSADVILLNHTELAQLPKAIQIAQHTLLTIKQNLFWAFAYNIVAIPIAAMGYLNPMWGALFMAFSDVIVIGNSIRLKYKRI